MDKIFHFTSISQILNWDCHMPIHLSSIINTLIWPIDRSATLRECTSHATGSWASMGTPLKRKFRKPTSFRDQCYKTVFPSNFTNIYLKYFRILQNLTRNWDFTKATIFHSIFFVKSLTFVPFCSIAMQYWHFVFSYCDKWNFSVCCCTVSPLGDIGKYFAIIKWKVICKISQIFSLNFIRSRIQVLFCQHPRNCHHYNHCL